MTVTELHDLVKQWKESFEQKFHHHFTEIDALKAFRNKWLGGAAVATVLLAVALGAVWKSVDGKLTDLASSVSRVEGRLDSIMTPVVSEGTPRAVLLVHQRKLDGTTACLALQYVDFRTGRIYEFAPKQPADSIDTEYPNDLVDTFFASTERIRESVESSRALEDFEEFNRVPDDVVADRSFVFTDDVPIGVVQTLSTEFSKRGESYANLYLHDGVLEEFAKDMWLHEVSYPCAPISPGGEYAPAGGEAVEEAPEPPPEPADLQRRIEELERLLPRGESTEARTDLHFGTGLTGDIRLIERTRSSGVETQRAQDL